MNNKLLLALGILGTVSLSGCTVLENMFKADSVDNTNAEYIGKASESLDIAVENLELLENTVIPSMSGTTYQLKDKDNNTYKCTILYEIFCISKYQSHKECKYNLFACSLHRMSETKH